MKEFKTTVPCNIRIKGKIIPEMDDKIQWNDSDFELAYKDEIGHWRVIMFNTEEEYKKFKFLKELKGK
jgi:hypothetical protein